MREHSTEQKLAGTKILPARADELLLDVLAGMPASFRRALIAQNRTRSTVVSYVEGLRFFYRFLILKGMPLQLPAIRREHIEEWLGALRQEPNPRTGRPVAASTLNKYYKVLHVYFTWALEEGEINAHPMAKMKRPAIPENPPPVLTAAQVVSVLKACEGKDFYSRRDSAIFRVLLDTGIRASELAGLTLSAINWQHNSLTVLGKGRRERAVPFGRKTAQALDRYIRLRRNYPTAALPNLWLGHAGKALTTSGIQQMMKDRGAEAGIPDLHPHLFRHEAAHNWLSEGGTENGLMRIMGWRSRTMVARYAASAATQRAHEEHRRLQIGDKF